MEELDPFLEDYCREIGLDVLGKDVLPMEGEFSQNLVAAKLGDGLLSVFVLSVFCNVLIFIAVDGYRIIPGRAGQVPGAVPGRGRIRHQRL